MFLGSGMADGSFSCQTVIPPQLYRFVNGIGVALYLGSRRQWRASSRRNPVRTG